MAQDPTDVDITYQNGNWDAPPHYTVRYDDVSVAFINDSDEDCKIVFSNPKTFGTSFVGLAAKGTISINILQRETTGYQLQRWSGSTSVAAMTGQHTIEVNNTALRPQPIAVGTGQHTIDVNSDVALARPQTA
jgi:hypothetical protein